MVDLLNHAPCPDVGVSKDFGLVQDRTTWYAGFLQYREPVGPGLGGSHGFDLSGQLVAILHPMRVVYVLRAANQVWPADDLSTAFPGTLVGCTKSDVAVCAPDGLVGCKHAMG